MAKVNLERRAEIGQEKRARTRAQLIAAASALFAKRSWASVTIDDLVREAGVAKGTFYVHFEDMHALTVAVAGELIHSFDEIIQGRRAWALPIPCCARRLPGLRRLHAKGRSRILAWGALVTRIARSNRASEKRRVADERGSGARAQQSYRQQPSVVLALEAAIGVVLQVLAAIGEGRLKGAVAQPAVGAVLGAIGIGKQQAATTLAKLKRAKAAPIERAPAA